MLPSSAKDHYRAQQAISVAAAERVGRLWRARVGEDFELGWNGIAAEVFAIVSGAQAAAAANGIQYVPAVLAEQGIDLTPVADVDPSRFMGGTADGRPLETLLHGATYEAKRQIAVGQDVRGALFATGGWLTGVVLGQVRDADRQAVTATMAVTPTATGWTRMLNPPSCKFCVTLAGKWYRFNEGFQAHTNCIPAGVAVSSPGVEAATRRWYSGELVVLRTASGDELPVTGNHPVLTGRGWVPARLLREGDEIVRSRTGHVTPTVSRDEPRPDKDQVPALVEDVWAAHSVAGVRAVKGAAEDFHGDGADGEVHVVAADRSLAHKSNVSFEQPVGELGLLGGGIEARIGGTSLSVLRTTNELRLLPGPVLQARADLRVPLGALSGSAHGVGALSPLALGLSRQGQAGRNIGGAKLNARFAKPMLDGAARYVEPPSEFGSASAINVGMHEFRNWQRDALLRWDAPAEPFSIQSRGMYASRGLDLLGRLAGQVELDRLVSVERKQWSGHVYNLTSTEGWYSAANMILSNCDCRHIPTTESLAGDLTVDPYAYFQSLDKQTQDRVFGKNDAEALRSGADIYRVVNVRSRGLADDRLKRTSGRNRGWQSRRYDSPSKLTVDEVIASAGGDRARTVELLRENGYITGDQVAGGNILGNRGNPFAAGALGGGGTRVGATRAYRQAVASGVRDPLEPATQTAAERRLHSAYLAREAVRAGRNPFGTTARNPLTSQIRATVERNYRRQVAGLEKGPEQLRILARLLGIT